AQTGERKSRRMFERLKAFVAAVARIDVDHHQPVGADSEIGLRREIAPPMFDDAALGRGGEDAVRRELAVGMLCSVLAARSAATVAAAGTEQATLALNRPIHRKDRVTTLRQGERCEQDGR